MIKIGLDIPQSGVAHSIEEANVIAKEISQKQESASPIIRPVYTLGGSGGVCL